ncbi:LacI family DNA-binding transcriptional regulator [Donghicola mangrovi]|uniref:Substrate-binding domain-containing protein n=1 Tax=Donghicola mangrovi TaxID=2729614 RepID=A0A850QA12_9RHOB|nr:LacI family DNA-binding transcriptional regulator [Donghicola mangrovi]NVO25734.1 substrate-binding domain-containing protein [Donghicola mangrovi]
MAPSSHPSNWRGPTITEIAELAGVGTASVDRVMNNRPGVKEKTRQRVMNAYNKLMLERGEGGTLDLRLFCESGEGFNEAMKRAAVEANRTVPGILITPYFETTSDLDPIRFARRMQDDGAAAQGVILVAREHPAINRAARALMAQGVPVVCLTTDLPSSRRATYIGNDQHAAGSVAAHLIGQTLPDAPGRILLVMSETFRCQQEREMGFRRVLRANFPKLKIEERLLSDDRAETIRAQMLAHFDASGFPDAVYNTAGANRGVAQALTERGAADVIFVGHELTVHSKALLENGVMDYLISHDFAGEMAQAARWILQTRKGASSDPLPSQILIHTRFNCDLQT